MHIQEWSRETHLVWKNPWHQVVFHWGWRMPGLLCGDRGLQGSEYGLLPEGDSSPAPHTLRHFAGCAWLLQWELVLSQVLWLGFSLDGHLNDEPLKLLFADVCPAPSMHTLCTSLSLFLLSPLSLSPSGYSGVCAKPLDFPCTSFPLSLFASLFLRHKSFPERS